MQNFTIRSFEESDIPELCRWIESYKWPTPAIDNVMPKSGYMGLWEDEPAACAFLYLTNTSAARLSWTASNKSMPRDIQTAALKELISGIIRIVKDVAPEVKMIEMETRSEAFAQVLKNLGFEIEKGYILCRYVVKS